MLAYSLLLNVIVFILISGYNSRDLKLVSVDGALDMIFALPRTVAKTLKFKLKDIIKRYFAGDRTLISEIETNTASGGLIAQMACGGINNSGAGGPPPPPPPLPIFMQQQRFADVSDNVPLAVARKQVSAADCNGAADNEPTATVNLQVQKGLGGDSREDMMIEMYKQMITKDERYSGLVENMQKNHEDAIKQKDEVIRAKDETIHTQQNAMNVQQNAILAQQNAISGQRDVDALMKLLLQRNPQI